MTTLVIDTGQSIIGIYSVEDGEYVAYRGERIADALQRIQKADTVITYNGERRDLLDLARFAGSEDFHLSGEHCDMQVKVWAPIVGSSLVSTYNRHFTDCPECPFMDANATVIDDYEADNRRDVYMTLKLWELWQADKLKLVGDRYSHHTNGG